MQKIVSKKTWVFKRS